MRIELGNHDCALPSLDERPKVTTVHTPDADEHGLGGYSHKPEAITAAKFKEHIVDARLFNDGITQLPDHEALLAIEAAWPRNGRGRPAWVKAHPHDGLTPDGVGDDLEKLLSDFYEIPTLEQFYKTDDPAEAQVRKEIAYWTPNGPPGENRGLILPDMQAVYTNDGRVMNNNNDGGDTLQSIMNGTGSAATATTLTTGQTLVTNATAGHRIYVFTTSGSVFVWGNCISNTNAAGASVITVDQWYNPLTPGAAVGATPGTPWAWVLMDGGLVSTWFAAIGTGGAGWAAGDHSIAVSSGSVEYTQAGGTMIRKQSPTATTSGVSTRTVTLVPVFTANASDVANLPKDISVVAFFASMVVSYAGAGGPMKFIDAVSPTARLGGLNDQLTITEVITGS